MSDKKNKKSISNEQAKQVQKKIFDLYNEFCDKGEVSEESISAIGNVGAVFTTRYLANAMLLAGKKFGEDPIKFDSFMTKCAMALEVIVNKKLGREFPGLPISFRFLPFPYDGPVIQADTKEDEFDVDAAPVPNEKVN